MCHLCLIHTYQLDLVISRHASDLPNGNALAISVAAIFCGWKSSESVQEMRMQEDNARDKGNDRASKTRAACLT